MATISTALTASAPSPSALAKMSTARGFVKSDTDGLVGTFNIDGGERRLSVNVNLPNQFFECSNATLTYGSADKLVDRCTWSGTIGKVNLRMNLGEGVSITGTLDVPRQSSVHARGAGTWKAASTSSVSANPFTRKRGDNSHASVGQAQPVPNPLDVDEDPRELERERLLLESGAPIITILGQSGTGKSTLINLIALEQQQVGRGLQSCTSKIRVIEANVAGKPVVIIDTPGIDDTRPGMSETDTLIEIASRLEAMGRHRVWVTGVLYLHRISDNKFSPTANRISNMLKSLCGDAAMDHLMLCTTMWDKVSREEGDMRFEELCNTGAWKEMVSKGANTGQISSVSPNAREDVEDILVELITNALPVELAIQDEMINQGKTVGETGAGMVLTEHLREAREEAEREMQEIREHMRRENEANEARAREALLAQEREVERLRRVTDEQDREARANAVRHQQERQRAEREMDELRETMRRESEANAARARDELRAREREAEEWRRQTEEQARAQQAYAERMQQEREDADRRMRELRDSIRAESQANAARLAEATATQQRQIAELRQQNQRLAAAPRPHPWWQPIADFGTDVLHHVGRALGPVAGGVISRIAGGAGSAPAPGVLGGVLGGRGGGGTGASAGAGGALGAARGFLGLSSSR